MQIIDLSIPIENNVQSDPPGLEPKIQYIKHKDAMAIGGMINFFPGLTAQDLPDSEAWAFELINLNTHNGTHLDAPWHFHSTMDNGEPSLTIDEIPLDWCFKPGVKLDFRHYPDGHVITRDEMAKELEKINHTLKPLEIVLINTSAGELYGQPNYVSSGCGIGKDATLFLLEQGIKITGTDAWSWDAPFIHTKQKYEQTEDPTIIWEGHKASKEIGYCHLEKLHNLEQLPTNGFTVCCFPVKIKKASAGWTRAVAII